MSYDCVCFIYHLNTRVQSQIYHICNGVRHENLNDPISSIDIDRTVDKLQKRTLQNVGIETTVKCKYETVQPIFFHYVFADKPDLD